MQNWFVCWSICIQTSNVRKLKAVHIPATESALGAFEFEWEIQIAEKESNIYRIVNYQNIRLENKEKSLL